MISRDSIFTDTYIQLSKSIADLYYLTNQPHKAIPLYEEVRSRIAKVHIAMNLDYASICNNLGNLYNVAGEMDTARALHLKAKDIREKILGNTSPAYAQSCNNLGALYHDLGKFDMAEPLFLEAKAIREKIEPVKKSAAYAITCVALANLYRDMGQYERSELLYLEAKEIRALVPPVKETADYALSCNILADLYYYMGQFKKAEMLYLEAKQIREKIGKGNYEYGQTCNNLASLYRDMAQYEKAEALALEAKEIYEKVLPEGHGSRTIQINNLGELYYAMGKYKESESFFLQAGEIWKKKLGKDHPYYIANSEELARVYWNTNETEKANKLLTEVSAAKYSQLNKIFRFTNESEKELYLKNINGSSDEYYSFYYNKIPRNKAGQSFAMSLLNRNLILSSTQQVRQIIYNSGDTALTITYKEWTGIKEQLAKLYSMGGMAKAELVNSLEEKADNIEKGLSRKSAAFKRAQKKINWLDIQQNLKKNETAIEFAEFHLNDGRRWKDSILYVALVLRKSTDPLLVPLFEKKQLDSLLVQNSFDEVTSINQQYSSPDLFNLIWRPIEKYLPGISKVYFAPAGNLFRISFGALPMNSKHVLSDKYQLIQLNTTAMVTGQTPDFVALSDRIQLYGGIQYDADTTALKAAVLAYHNNHKTLRSLPDDPGRGKNLQYLPGTQEEVDEIKKLAARAGATVSVLSGINASEESLNSLNGTSSPAILHIATHGFFFPDPATDKSDSVQRKFETSGKAFRRSANPLMRAGLLFAGANNAWRGRFITGIEDGIVTAYEVSTTMYLPNTKLVVLSACETALGDIQGSEGVYGLQRAFKMAGVKNLVMSLWKVPDAETSGFMQAFYSNIFNKLSVSDAFYKAQNSMKIKYRNDPYKWAAWVLIR